ncbi:MAG: PAS domain-containing protein [Bryobacteraceae bacterium]
MGINRRKQRLTYDVHQSRGFTGAAALISTGRGQEIINRFATLIDALQREERDLLAQRETQSLFILSAGTCMGLGLLLSVLFLLNSDAVARREAEAASRLAAEILASTSDGVITTTLAGIITSWNPGAKRVLGHTAQETVGSPLHILIPPECADEENEILAAIGRGARFQAVAPNPPVCDLFPQNSPVHLVIVDNQHA